jgi:hypothetical protein
MPLGASKPAGSTCSILESGRMAGSHPCRYQDRSPESYSHPRRKFHQRQAYRGEALEGLGAANLRGMKSDCIMQNVCLKDAVTGNDMYGVALYGTKEFVRYFAGP